ncbi:MAG: helix-turn-helix domain-containing protein [Candidatus Aminicenantes bacterium]|nr:helix-turn-helix domain-containing protein [Candidatus Aminicenantes bacterium]
MKPETSLPELLTAQEARKILRVGKNTIYDLARGRKLEYIKIGGKILFQREAIEKFIRQHTIPAARNFFSVDRARFRKHAGGRVLNPYKKDFSESIDQDCSHSFRPVRKNRPTFDQSQGKWGQNKKARDNLCGLFSGKLAFNRIIIGSMKRMCP